MDLQSSFHIIDESRCGIGLVAREFVLRNALLPYFSRSLSDVISGATRELRRHDATRGAPTKL